MNHLVLNRLALNRLPLKRNFLTIVNAWERGVRLSFGKYSKTLEPGIRINIPIYHKVYKVNMADRVADMNKQSLISRDNVTFYIDSSVKYRVVDAKKSLLNVTNLPVMLMDICQMALRKTLSTLEINEILHDLADVSNKIKASLSYLENEWGIEISSIQIKDISFDDTMKRAMAVKAEADRNAEAKIINANADVKTAEIYKEASKLYAENPISLRLREFQLWNSVSKNPSTTIYVIPSNILDIMKPK